MRTKTIIIITAIFSILFYHQIAFSLEVATHKAINLRIADSTMNGFSLDQYLKSNLGFSRGVSEIFKGQKVDEWIRDGGLYEDKPSWTIPYTRSMNHFHNPLKTWDSSGFKGTFQSSVIWAQEQGTFGSLWGGDWSWKKARNSFYKGLTDITKTDRENDFADTFRAFGQIMHLVEDVSVPAHTRNDAHVIGYHYELAVDKLMSKLDPVFTEAVANPITFDPSIFTFTPNPLAPIPIAKIFDTDQYNGSSPNITAFNTIGLSEYTNANFVSEGLISANFQDFPYPRIQDTIIIGKAYTSASGTYTRQYYSKNCCGETYSGKGYLLSVVDYLDYWRQKNPLLSVGLPKIPGLDDNVYKDYASLLIPRAVGYSAGLLNYFFRGNIEMTLPSSGLYAKIDDPNQVNSGFNQLTLLAKNTSPNNEQMSDGSIEVVVKYRLAQSDPFHSIAPPVSEEFFYIVAPEANGIRSIPRDSPVELSFDLSQTPIPLYATDVYLQIVYNGRLGNEDSAVAVGFKDISEPTPIDEYNNMDKICIYGQWYNAGSQEAYNALPESAKWWDYWSHNLRDEYIRVSLLGSPVDASPSEYTFYSPLIQAGTLYRVFILSDYKFSYSGYGIMEPTDARDLNDHSLAFKKVTAQGAGVRNQEEYSTEEAFCSNYGLTAPCTVRRTSLFYPFRGVEIWGPGGIITDGLTYPNPTDPNYIPCEWSALAQ